MEAVDWLIEEAADGEGRRGQQAEGEEGNAEEEQEHGSCVAARAKSKVGLNVKSSSHVPSSPSTRRSTRRDVPTS